MPCSSASNRNVISTPVTAGVGEYEKATDLSAKHLTGAAVNDRVVKVEIHQDLHAERIAGVEHAQTNHVKKHHNPIQSAKNILIVVTLISILVGLFVTIGGMMGWL